MTIDPTADARLLLWNGHTPISQLDQSRLSKEAAEALRTSGVVFLSQVDRKSIERTKCPVRDAAEVVTWASMTQRWLAMEGRKS